MNEHDDDNRRTFLNISNHPSGGWSASQRDEALALGGLDGVDDWAWEELQVDPDATTDDVIALAASIAHRVISQGYQHAMVAGEPVLTWNLVRLLSDAGVTCYAATTAREVTEEQLEDGSVRKVARFRFIRWRRYTIDGSDHIATTISGESMNLRIVSILGLGTSQNKEGKQTGPRTYQSCRYNIDIEDAQFCSGETRLVQEALIQFATSLGASVSVSLFGTTAVRERWVENNENSDHDLMSELKSIECEPKSEWERTNDYIKLANRVVFVPIQDGRTKDELNNFLGLVLPYLSAEPLDRLDESAAPDEIWIDVTHGFRIQPMMLLFGLSAQLAEQRRRGDGPRYRLWYGAFEAINKENNIAPLWELTDYLDVTQWTAAIEAITRFGSGADFARLAKLDSMNDERRVAAINTLRNREATEEEINHAIAIRAEVDWLKRLGDSVRQLSDDLKSIRTADLLVVRSTAVKRLLANPHRQNWENRNPLLTSPMRALEDWVDRLDVNGVYTMDGLKALIALARIYRDIGSQSELVAVLREALVTATGLLIEPPLDNPERGQRDPNEPGRSGNPAGADYRERRRNHDALLNHVTHQELRNTKESDTKSSADAGREELATQFAALSDAQQGSLKALAKIASAIVDPRNDVLHAGMRAQPLPAESISGVFSEQLSEFERLVDDCFSPRSSE